MKKQKITNVIKYKCPVYNATIYFMIGSNDDYIELVKKELKIDYNSTESVYADGSTHLHIHSGHAIIFVRTSRKDVSVLFHEIIHTKNFIFNHCGVDTDTANDEHEAYYSAHLFSVALSLYKK